MIVLENLKSLRKQVWAVILFAAILVFASFFSSVVSANSTVLTVTVELPAECGNNDKETGEQCDGTDLGVNSCTTLGFDSGSLSCSAGCQFSVASCVTDAEDSGSNTFDRSLGGELELANGDGTGATINIPVNAYSSDLSVFAFSRLSSDVSSANPAPQGESFVGNVYDFLLFDESGSEVETLINSATISIDYSDADFANLDEAEIEPFHWNEDDSVWYLVSGSSLNQSANSINFTSSAFSLFGIFSEPPAEVETPSSGGGSAPGFLRLFGLASPYSFSEVDVNGDSSVDIRDLSIMLYFQGKTGPEIGQYDVNNDNVVDIVDLSIVFYYWTK